MSKSHYSLAMCLAFWVLIANIGQPPSKIIEGCDFFVACELTDLVYLVLCVSSYLLLLIRRQFGQDVLDPFQGISDLAIHRCCGVHSLSYEVQILYTRLESNIAHVIGQLFLPADPFALILLEFLTLFRRELVPALIQ